MKKAPAVLLLLLFFACKEPTQAEREIMLWQLTEANDLCNQNTLQQLQVMRLISKGQENKGIEQVYSLSMAIWQRMQTLCSGYRNSKHVHPEHADTLSRDMQQLKLLIPACFGRAYYLKNAGYPGWTEPEPGNSEELKLARLHNNMSILFAVLRKSLSFGSLQYYWKKTAIAFSAIKRTLPRYMPHSPQHCIILFLTLQRYSCNVCNYARWNMLAVK